MKLIRLFAAVCATSIVGAAPGHTAESAAPAVKDALQAVLLESKEKNRGVTVHANGSNIGMVVIAIEGDYVIGRSQQTSRIVIRLDRIDGVSALF